MTGGRTVGGFVITFRRPCVLAETLATLFAQSDPPDEVLVVDNAGCPETARVVAEQPRALYRDAEGNRGPAGAAALGVHWALERGFDWIYWGDDDDPPRTSDTLERLLRLAASLDDREVGGVAAFGARWDWDRGELVRPQDHELRGGPLAIDAAGGNSQLLLRAEAVETIGLPDETLFFGLEEIEYCLRLRRQGYGLWVDGDLLFEYRTLAGRLGATPRRRAVTPLSRGQIWRQYYHTRNTIHLMRRTFDHPQLARREAVRALARALLSFRRGLGFGARFAVLQLRGVIDGYRDRMGRTVEPTVKEGGDSPLDHEPEGMPPVFSSMEEP